MSLWSPRQQGLLAALGLAWPLGRTAAEPAPTAPAPVETLEAPQAPAPRAVEPQAQPVASPAGPKLDRAALDAAMQACRACGLCQQRRQALPGVGAQPARWMVVGEAPGEQDDAQGEPFVGEAGALLDALLASLGLSRHAQGSAQPVFITHAVKCRPPPDRIPQPEDLAACRPFLQRQIELVDPRLLLLCGLKAAHSVLGGDASLASLRGRVHRLADGRAAVVLPSLAYLLRQPQEKGKVWEDLCMAMDAAEAA